MMMMMMMVMASLYSSSTVASAAAMASSLSPHSRRRRRHISRLQSPHLSSPICRNSSFATRCSLGSYQDNVYKENLWQRLQLLQRLLDVSIMDENYVQAKEINDQLSRLKAQLSEKEQLMLEKLSILAKGSTNEKIQIISEFGSIGDDQVLPMLSNGLLDKNPLIALETEKAMWKIFMHSGRQDVEQYLQEGVSLMISNDLPKARDVFSQIIKLEPCFAEGWNKRATVNYLLKEYRASIADCIKTLELNAYHFGAMSGMGLCFAALGDSESALIWLQKAHAMHPGLAQIDKLIKNLKQNLDGNNNENFS